MNDDAYTQERARQMRESAKAEAVIADMWVQGTWLFLHYREPHRVRALCGFAPRSGFKVVDPRLHTYRHTCPRCHRRKESGND